MAITDTIRVGISTEGSNTAIDQPISKTLTITRNNEGGPTPGVINLTTTHELIDLTELTNKGWCYLHNLGPDTVYWGFNLVGVVKRVGEMRVDEPALFRMYKSIAAFGMYSTGTAQVEIFCWED